MIRATAVCALSLFAAATASADEIRPYTSTQWGFSALFPWAISEATEDPGIQVSAGNPDDTVSYMIGASPVSPAVLKEKGTDGLLEAAVEGARSNMKARIVSKRAVALDGNPGREFVVATDKFNGTCRIYVAGLRLYVVMMISAPGSTLPMSAAAFQAGFRILPENKRRPK